MGGLEYVSSSEGSRIEVSRTDVPSSLSFSTRDETLGTSGKCSVSKLHTHFSSFQVFPLGILKQDFVSPQGWPGTCEPPVPKSPGAGVTGIDHCFILSFLMMKIHTHS